MLFSSLRVPISSINIMSKTMKLIGYATLGVFFFSCGSTYCDESISMSFLKITHNVDHEMDVGRGGAGRIEHGYGLRRASDGFT